MSSSAAASLAADIILIVHVAIAAFITIGLLLIWIGALAGWRWIRNPWFRALHLGAIVFVAVQAVIGRICPLTIWEDRLRGVQTGSGFIERHLSALLYWDLPTAAFTAMYVGFALAVALTLWRIPPRRFASEPPQP